MSLFNAFSVDLSISNASFSAFGVDVSTEGAIASGVELSGYANAEAKTTSAIGYNINLGSITASLATAKGIISATLPLSGQAVIVSKSSGSLGGMLALSGGAVSEALTQAALSTGIDLSGQSISDSALGGVFAISVQMSGTAISEAYTSGDISLGDTGTQLSGRPVSESAAGGGLAFSIPLSSLSVSSSSTSGNVTSILLVSGAISAVSQINGDITMAVALSGDALTTALTSGDLTLRFSLDGSVVAEASTAAQLSINNGGIELSGGAIASASNDALIKAEARSPAYDEYVKTAKEARDDIASEGVELEFTRYAKIESNPIIGTVTKTATTGKFKCLILPASKGTVEAFDNRRDSLKSSHLRFLIIAAYGAPFGLLPGDKAYFDSHTWEVLGSTPVGPGGVPIIYRVGVKR